MSPLDIFCATVKSRPERIQLVEFVMGNANDCAAVRDDLEDDADDISIRVQKAPLVASGAGPTNQRYMWLYRET